MNKNKIEFKKIISKLQKEENLWLIAERKWTLNLNKKILNQKNNKTGIFITDNINWEKFNEYEDCVRMVFFNESVQYQFIKTDEDNYIYHKSKIEGNIKNEEKVVNVSKKDENSKSNFRFKFAISLDVINDLTQNNAIQVIKDDENGEWRLYHATNKV